MNYHSARGVGWASSSSRSNLPRNADIAALFPGDSDSSEDHGNHEEIITNTTRLPITSPKQRRSAANNNTTTVRQAAAGAATTGIAALFPTDEEEEEEEGDEAGTDGGRSSPPPSNGITARRGRSSDRVAVRISSSPTRPESRDNNDVTTTVNHKQQSPQDNARRGGSGSSSNSSSSSSSRLALAAGGFGRGKKGYTMKTAIPHQPAMTTGGAAPFQHGTAGSNGGGVGLGAAAAASGEEGVVKDKERDIEAAVTTPEVASKASIQFELNKDRNPAEWMKVGDTTGTSFLWYTLVLQAASACASVVYLVSAAEDQLTWRTGCWGEWTSLPDAEGIDFVEFDTHVGWQLYGKGDKFGHLGEVSRRTAIMGGLAGAVHTIMIFFGCTFLLFSLSALCLSYGNGGCFGGAGGGGGHGKGKRGGNNNNADADCEEVLVARKQASPLVLGYDCHRWMFVMAVVNVLAGLWCFVVGCVGFYFVVASDFTDGIEKMVSEWGESVTCATAQTIPRYGFFANGVAAFLLLGGGTISLVKTYASDRELREAIEMWKSDRIETAEMEARIAMIRKKEDYAAAAAAAAYAAVSVGRVKKSTAADETTTTPTPSTPPTPSPDSQSPRHPTPPPAHDTIVETGSVGCMMDNVQLDVITADRDVEKGEGALLDGGAEAAVVETPPPSPPPPLSLPSPSPPPTSSSSSLEGWDERSTPSGEKFWVNVITKEVCWECPL